MRMKSRNVRFHDKRHTNMPSQGAELVQLCELTDGEKNSTESGTSLSLLSMLSLKRYKKKHGVPMNLELVEESSWSRSFNSYSRLTSRNEAYKISGSNCPLQTLDARILLRHQGATSASSLDLEWEHEVMPSSLAYNLEVECTNGSPSYTSINGSQPSSLTASQWSKISTPNSLEWDPVEADMACVDIETEQLLNEIERLTDRTLKETGEWTGSPEGKA